MKCSEKERKRTCTENSPYILACGKNGLSHISTGNKAGYVSFSHQSIVRLFDYFVDGKHMHLVMEYLPGGSLADKLDKVGHFSENESALVRPLSDFK